MSNKFYKLLFIAIILILSFFVHLFYGLPISSLSKMDKIILFDIRLPRALLAFFVGGGLALSGVVLQGVFRNNLVEPYTLGVSGGAACGVAISIALSLDKYFGYYIYTFGGLLGALGVLIFLYSISMRKKRFDINQILLIGVMISFISSAFIMLILSTAKMENLNEIVFWMMGSLSEPKNILIYFLGIISIAGTVIFYYLSTRLNAIQLGYEKAISLGVNVEKTIKISVFSAAIITAISVCSTGIIGFVGLIVPHILRKFFLNDYRYLTISSFFAGGAFLLLSDIVSRTIIYPNELPVGVITGLLGGFMFIYLFRKGMNNQ